MFTLQNLFSDWVGFFDKGRGEENVLTYHYYYYLDGTQIGQKLVPTGRYLVYLHNETHRKTYENNNTYQNIQQQKGNRNGVQTINKPFLIKSKGHRYSFKGET